MITDSHLNLKVIFIFILIVFHIFTLKAGNNPKEIKVYLGSTPVLDGIISPGEYDDATQFTGIKDWSHEIKKGTVDSLDLSIKIWVKHDGKNLYFAFDITDDVIYGIDIPRWLPDKNPDVHDFTLNSWSWFGDGVEIFLNPENKWNDNDNEPTKGNGYSWQMVCSTHKSFDNKLNSGGLIECEPRNKYSWSNYRKWLKSGAMKAKVHIKTKSEGHGYVIEWMISPKPCLEIAQNKFWNPGMGIVKMGFNIEVQDLDEKERGAGNWGDMHHVELWAADLSRKGKTLLKNLGNLTIYPEQKP